MINLLYTKEFKLIKAVYEKCQPYLQTLCYRNVIRHHRSKISFQIFPICLAILHYCIIENLQNLNAEICYKRIRENHPNSFINVNCFYLSFILFLNVH